MATNSVQFCIHCEGKKLSKAKKFLCCEECGFMLSVEDAQLEKVSAFFNEMDFCYRCGEQLMKGKKFFMCANGCGHRISLPAGGDTSSASNAVANVTPTTIATQPEPKTSTQSTRKPTITDASAPDPGGGPWSDKANEQGTGQANQQEQEDDEHSDEQQNSKRETEEPQKEGSSLTSESPTKTTPADEAECSEGDNDSQSEAKRGAASSGEAKPDCKLDPKEKHMVSGTKHQEGDHEPPASHPETVTEAASGRADSSTGQSETATNGKEEKQKDKDQLPRSAGEDNAVDSATGSKEKHVVGGDDSSAKESDPERGTEISGDLLGGKFPCACSYLCMLMFMQLSIEINCANVDVIAAQYDINVSAVD